MSVSESRPNDPVFNEYTVEITNHYYAADPDPELMVVVSPFDVQYDIRGEAVPKKIWIHAMGDDPAFSVMVLTTDEAEELAYAILNSVKVVKDAVHQ